MRKSSQISDTDYMRVVRKIAKLGWLSCVAGLTGEGDRTSEERMRSEKLWEGRRPTFRWNYVEPIPVMSPLISESYSLKYCRLICRGLSRGGASYPPVYYGILILPGERGWALSSSSSSQQPHHPQHRQHFPAFSTSSNHQRQWWWW